MSTEAMEVREAAGSYVLKAEKEVPPGYKRTEVGVIPEDWNVYRLADHFVIYAGGDVPKDDYSDVQSENHPYPIYANAIKEKGLYGYTSLNRGKPNSLTITARGYLGHAEYRSKPFFPIVRLLVLEPCGRLDAKYTTYVINERVQFAIESTGVPQLTAPQVGKYLVAAPSTLEEQRAIATALSDVDALITALYKLIAKKRAIKTAAMQQLLTGKTRLPGFSGEWETKRFGEIASIRNTKVFPSNVPWGTLCVELEDIGQGSGRLIGYSEAHQTSSAKYRFMKGDILFGRLRPYLRKYWLAEEDGICSTEIWPLVIDKGQAFNGFVYAIIQTDRFIEVAGVSYGTHMPRADWNVLCNFEVALPGVEEQTAIAQVLSDMDAEIAALEARRDKTRAIKQGMMQQLLTGRVRLV